MLDWLSSQICYPLEIKLLLLLLLLYIKEPRHDKTNKMSCTQRRLRSAWASAQSDQSLRCPHEETLVLSYQLSVQRRL